MARKEVTEDELDAQAKANGHQGGAHQEDSRRDCNKHVEDRDEALVAFSLGDPVTSDGRPLVHFDKDESRLRNSAGVLENTMSGQEGISDALPDSSRVAAESEQS
jgi:hypothetical protein